MISFFVTTALAEKKIKNILFFGDSITAGYGIQADQAYPALVQKKIDSLGLNFRVINAGLSGDTTAAGEQRLRWSLRQKADVLVLALGGNDGLRGIPVETTQTYLQRMIDYAKKKQPGIIIVLAGIKMPPNYGADYAEQFSAIYPALAKKNKIPLIPFLLEGVGGIEKMNLPDRIHPTAAGHVLIAETVWKTLRPVLK